MHKKTLRSRDALFLILFGIVFASLIIFIIEYGLYLTYRSSSFISSRFYYSAISTYMSKQRNVVQYNPQCAEYDELLGYKFRNNAKCRVDNLEFSTDYEFNSFGSRDDEESLNQPEIVLLGDSHILGWGVQKKESLDNKIENLTGKRSLNLGVSSYGTVREAILYSQYLKKFKSKPKYIIWQYCSNDFGENNYYYNSGNKFKTTILPQQFKKLIAYNGAIAEPIILPMIRRFLPKLFDTNSYQSTKNNLVSPSSINKNITTAVDRFLNILASYKNLLQDTEIIVINLEGNGLNHPFFIKELETQAKLKLPKLNINPVDISTKVKKKDYYDIDDHPKESAYSKIALLLRKYLH